MSRRTIFENIDILRGFAALSVVVYHIIEIFNWTTFISDGPLVWFRTGWMGVDLFFVISGFVIGLSAFSEIDKNGNRRFRWPFFKRRLARIVPLHYLTMLVFVVFIVPELLFERFWINICYHLVFLHNFDIRFQGAINGSNWSLATEMQFYVLILLIAPWIRIANCWKIALTFIVITWTWRWGVTLNIPLSKELGSFPMFVAATQLPGMLDEFLAGLLLARLVRSSYSGKVLHTKNTKYLLLGSVIAVTFCMIIFWKYSTYWNYPLMVIFWRTLLGFPFALVVLTIISIRISGLTRLILSPLFYLGTISYGIYLWHLPVLLSLKSITWLSHMQVLFWGIALTCIFASISWHFFESPIIERWRRNS